jgi:nucleotide-binding universal stress UspA family protein
MYSKVILPLDGSEEAEKALPEAVRLTTHGVRELHIIRVLEVGTAWSAATVADAMDEAKAAAEQYLDSLSLGLRPAEVQITREVLVGASPALVIADYAEKIGADLIVMTCHGRSGFQQFLVGSQTERVLRLAKCSILVVR